LSYLLDTCCNAFAQSRRRTTSKIHLLCKDLPQ
jgi:hypothetical protein